jgi:hypothetical protein
VSRPGNSRSLESGLEGTFRDGSPDKIASQNMSREANSVGNSFDFLAGKIESSTVSAFSKYEFLTDKKSVTISETSSEKSSEGIFEKNIEKNLDKNSEKGVSDRDKVSFVSAAFCNPLFLVGMGAAMAVIDDLREAREARMEDALAGKIDGDRVNGFRKQADNDRQERANKLENETEEQRKKRLRLEALGLIGGGERGLGSVMPVSEGAIRENILKNGLRKQQQIKEMRGKMREKLMSNVSKGFDEKAAQRSVINWLKTNKLIKYKMKLENQMEKSRGKESLAFVSGLSSKLEQVDKILKRSNV